MAKRYSAMKRQAFAGLVAAAGILGVASEAQAQEIQLTGPLAGAPAVRKLRLHRKGRMEIALAPSFTLLDEYQRNIFLGARFNYNFTDWLAVGLWGAFNVVQPSTDLTDQTQALIDKRFDQDNAELSQRAIAGRRLTSVNVGKDFKKQLGTIQWVVAPQITVVPFRGKLSLFEKIFVDTDAYFFAGPAVMGVRERANCTTDCSGLPTDANDTATALGTKETANRIAFAPTFGLGMTFYTGSWTSIGLEWRGLPMSMNNGGFDSRGQGDNEKFPDNKVDEKDREFKFNQMVTVSFSIYLPRLMKVSE